MNYKELCKETSKRALNDVLFSNNKDLLSTLRCIKGDLVDLWYEFIFWGFAFLYLLFFPITSFILYRTHKRYLKKEDDYQNKKKKLIKKRFPNIKQKELQPDRF